MFKPPSSHPQIDSLFFILSLLDLSSIPRAREGGPWGLPAPKSDRRSWDDRSPLVANVLFRVFFVFLRFFFVFQFFYSKLQFYKSFGPPRRAFSPETDRIKHCKNWGFGAMRPNLYCKIQYNRHFASKNAKIAQKSSRKTEFRSNMFRSCLSGTVLGPTLGPLSPQWSRSGGPLGPLKASLGALWRPLGSISGPWAPFAVSFLHQTFTPQASICIGGGKPATYYLLLLYPGQAECAKRLN